MVFKGQRAFDIAEKLYYYFPVTVDGTQGFACLEGKLKVWFNKPDLMFILLLQIETLLVYYNFTV